MGDINIKADSVTGEDTGFKPGITKEAISRDKLITTDIQHLPFERVPDSKLAYAADQCLQVVLDRLEEARALFLKVVEAWMLPGCIKPIYDAAWQSRKQIRNYTAGALKYDAMSRDEN